MKKELFLPIVSDGYLFPASVKLGSTFSVPITQLIIDITVPTGISLQSASPDTGSVDFNNNRWVINNLAPEESITGSFTFRVDDGDQLPGTIEFKIANPPMGDNPMTDNEVSIYVYGATCDDLLNTCFGSFTPYYREDKITLGDLTIHSVSAGVLEVTAVEDAVGEYTITMPASSKLESLYVEGNENTVTGSSEISLTVVDPAGNDIVFIGEVMSQLTGIQSKAASNGHQFSHDLSTAGQAVTTIQNLGFGATGFALLLKPVEKIN